MSYMSNKQIDLDEARDLSGIDLVECELSHYKDKCDEAVHELEQLLRQWKECSDRSRAMRRNCWDQQEKNELNIEIDARDDCARDLKQVLAKVKTEVK